MASLAGLAGDGITGDLTGTTTIFFLTTITLNPIAERFSTTMLSIAAEVASIIAGLTSVTTVSAFMAAGFVVETDFRVMVRSAATTPAEPRLLSMDLGRNILQRARTPERSVALITVVQPEVSPLPDIRAWVEAFTVEAASMVAAEDMLAEAAGN